ncbi:MAG: OmpA family protein [Chitinophagales bacterium]
MRLIKTLLIILLFCWYLIASFWYVCRIKQDCQSLEQYAWYQSLPFLHKTGIANTPKAPITKNQNLTIVDNGKTIVKTNSNFGFAQSSDLPKMDENLKKGMVNLATYISQNPDRQLTITGKYSSLENNQTNFDNLGLARAAHIRQHLIRKGANGNRINLKHLASQNLVFEQGQTQNALQFHFSEANNATPPTTKTSNTTKLSNTHAPTLPDFVVKNGNKIIIKTNEKFQYEKSASQPTMNPEIQKGLDALAAYLKKNPKKELQIMGFYGKNENNSSIFDDLGLARATHLQEILKKAKVPASQLSAVSKMLPTDVSENGLDGGIDMQINDKKTAQTPSANQQLVIKDGTKMIVQANENFYIHKSKAQVDVTPLLEHSLTEVANYAKQQKQRQLKIVGHYAPTEKNPTPIKNLGIARATEIQKKLVALGVPKSQIVLEGKANGKVKFTNEKHEGGLHFFFELNENLEKDLLVKPRILYFASGNAKLNVSDELRAYFANVKTYLKQDKTKKVVLTGHTDDEGQKVANDALGLQRAKTVKGQLEKIGIAKNRIVTQSKGETKPIESNKTEKGRQKNRRVEMIIK